MEPVRKSVCVTGAGGFVASELVKLLLSRGQYAVRGTVRDPGASKNAHLKVLEGAEERLQLLKADLMDYNSIASAVAGCEGVFHVASPVLSHRPSNPEVEVIAPAVIGTTNVLKACYEAKVKRVVVVSSCGAVYANPIYPKGKVFDEDCWSDEDYCRKKEDWYLVSKTLSEREALAFAAKTGLDVVTVCPSLVFGPLMQPTVNLSSEMILKYFKDLETVENVLSNMVDIRDVADALLLTYEKPEASGRYICSSHAIKISDMINILKTMYPSYPSLSQKTMPILHDVTIMELMLARRLEQYIADAIRTIVLEFGVDDMLLTVWDHFELSDCSKIPIQQVTQNINATIGIITTDVILFVPIASSQIKLVNDKIRMAYTEVDGCSSGLNCDLFDFKKYLEEKGIVVKSSDDTLSSEADYIEIMNTSKTGEHKVAVTGPICQDFNNILGHLMSWWL